MPDNERLLTVDEVADRLQVPKSTIYFWTHTSYIPHLKIGRFVRFRLSDLDRWILQKRKRVRKSKNLSPGDTESGLPNS